MARQPTSFGHRPGLDGVRALAVVAVLLYHGGVSWMPGGFLGVEVFFVLSGYLITSLLLAEFARDAGISLRSFWIRRARRLLPAAWALLAGVFVLVLFHPAEIARFFRELPSALSYVYNWFLVLSEQSYFASMGRPSPLRHLWSLAVEEQFYLVWPIMALVALRSGGRRRLLALSVVGALVSLFITLVLYVPGADPSRIYFGTDTRAAGLLLGAAGAVLWHPSRPISGLHRVALTRVGMVALGLLGVAFWQVDEFGSFLYRGGLFLVSIASLLLVVAAADPDNVVARALSTRPLQWLGSRSYALYLWHWPVMVFTRPQVDVALDGWRLLALQLVLSGVLAEASHRLVETRFRRVHRRHPQVDATPRVPVGRRRAVVAGGFATVALAAIGLLVVPMVDPVAEDASALAMASAQDDRAPGPTTDDPAPAPSLSPDDPTPRSATTADDASPDPTEAAGAPSPSAAPVEERAEDDAEEQVSAFGDSVMAGAVPEIEDAIDGAVVDADVGRTSDQLVDLVAARADAGDLAPTVVIHSGSNGPLPKGFVDRVMDVTGPDRRVLFVNVRVPLRWQDQVNRALASGVANHDNATLVDWYGTSSGHAEWFTPDGVHIIDRPGADQFAAMLVAAVA
nr:acyltransferase family protein [Salsipaludibacter albus]